MSTCWTRWTPPAPSRTSGRSRDEYERDRLLRSAVDRQFEIVGEALNRLRRDDPVVAGRVPDIAEIIGSRNVLIHGYDVVDRDAVWKAIMVEVPVLIRSFTELLSSLDPTQDPSTE